jgi:hypothetical protein
MIVFAAFFGIGALLTVSMAAQRTAENICDLEIRKAVQAGLQNDCVRLLEHWPFKQEMIDSSNSEYLKLPASIRMLEPAYVENESLDFTNYPPNIGICKNGFGGFSRGIRVFKTDAAANDYSKVTIGGNHRIAPGVYYWWHPT